MLQQRYLYGNQPEPARTQRAGRHRRPGPPDRSPHPHGQGRHRKVATAAVASGTAASR